MSVKSLNKVMLIGNVTRDPELRYTPQGNAVATFGLATNRSWKTETGEVKEEAEFHRLVAWNKLAELCSQLCTKGQKIYVEGRLQTRTFTGSDNAQHTITEIVIDDMILLGARPAGAGAGVPEVRKEEIKAENEVTEAEAKEAKPKTAKAAPKAAKTSDENAPQDVDADDIPF